MLKKFSKLLLSVLMSGLLFVCLPVAHAQKDFADVKVVLQISDADPSKQTLVLNVASNLKKHYGPDSVDVEIVAFGPGLRLLTKGNSNTKRIQGLSSSGVRFTACGNTIDKMTSLLGKPVEINDKAKVVPGGAVQILDLVKQGYTLIKP